MPNHRSKRSTWNRLARRKAPPPSNGGYSYGGGPTFSDSSRFRRSPSAYELAEAYKSIIYICCKINYLALCRLPLRLFVVTGTGQARPKSYLGAKPVARIKKWRLSKSPDPFVSKMMAGAEEVEEVTGDHPLLKVMTHVNDDLDLRMLLAYTSMCIDVNGNGYWWPNNGEGKIPDEMWALLPHLVTPIWRAATMVPDSFYYGGVEYKRGSLIRFRDPSMKNIYGLGMSATQAAIEYARLEDTFVSIQEQLLSNGPRPSVIISHKDPGGSFGKAERDRIDFEFNKKTRGGRAGNSVVVDGAVSVTPVSWRPADLGAIQISKYDMERTANCFGVPISMIAIESSNRAVADAGLEQHARQVVEPRSQAIASELTRWTHTLGNQLSKAVGYKVDYERYFWAFDPAVGADQQAEAELLKTLWGMGLPTNEVLTASGYDTVEGGDVSLVPNNLIPLTRLIAPPVDPVTGVSVGEPPAIAGADEEIEPDDQTDLDDEAEDTALDGKTDADEDLDDNFYEDSEDKAALRLEREIKRVERLLEIRRVS